MSSPNSPIPINTNASTTTTHQPWLSIIGIGEDGVGGLSARARSLIENAVLVAGGARHLALARDLIQTDTLQWPTPLTDAFPHIAKLRGQPVVVLATGDPFHYGVGNLFAQQFSADDYVCLPQPSAFSLAAAKLGWPVQDTTLVTLHGRTLERLNRYLIPGTRILALSWDETTPEKVASLLASRGLGDARLTILEALGGPNERVQTMPAHDFNLTGINPLNTLAIDLTTAENLTILAPALTPGLDDSCFDNDGQLTKREIRAITIAALNPRPGELLWDIGLGAGSIAIEWLLCHASLQAIGFEADPVRAARAAQNAATLGVPDLKIVTGRAPDVLKGQPAPDAVFIGGGLTQDHVFEAAWNALKPGGRLVANAVTLESEARLVALSARHGGSLTKIQISHARPVGRLHGWRQHMPVTQWRVQKPKASTP